MPVHGSAFLGRAAALTCLGAAFDLTAGHMKLLGGLATFQPAIMLALHECASVLRCVCARVPNTQGQTLGT